MNNKKIIIFALIFFTINNQMMFKAKIFDSDKKIEFKALLKTLGIVVAVTSLMYYIGLPSTKKDTETTEEFSHTNGKTENKKSTNYTQMYSNKVEPTVLQNVQPTVLQNVQPTAYYDSFFNFFAGTKTRQITTSIFVGLIATNTLQNHYAMTGYHENRKFQQAKKINRLFDNSFLRAKRVFKK